LFAKRAQPAVLIRFPIALFIASFAFDLLARRRRDGNLAIAAYYNLFAVAIATVPAVTTGLIAWQWLLAGQKFRGDLRLYLLFGTLSAGMIWLLCGWRARLRRSPELPLPSAYLAVALTAVFVRR
jgi:uncharacterized membrane protein